MPISRLAIRLVLLLSLAATAASTQADPVLTSWQTSKAAQYARIYETAAKFTSNTTVTTWPSSGLTNGDTGSASYNNQTSVANPTYSDVQRVASSTNYVYIYTTGLASYTMGNWLTPNNQTYTSWPLNRGAIHRIPRINTNPAAASIPATKQTVAQHGNGGVLVNGVLVWENGDAQSYKNAATSGSSSTASSADISMSGDGVWNRLAGVAEAFNFDTANAHQPSSGAYHNHINPKALRYQLGDNVTYSSATKTYSEGGTPAAHSPIIGWAYDGLPIYGPYGYSTATDATSGLRRMTSGFVKRNATNAALYPGMDDLAVTGRVKLPVWAASVQGISQTLASTKYGPTTTATYALGPTTKTCSVGTFAEDYEYLGDFGKVQGTDFDLNRQNVRYGVTPEYPSGTYAYFVCIDSSGNTVFPDVFNQEYFLTAANGQGTVSSISESVTEYADAGPAAAITVTGAASGSNVALSWNSSEGATYKVEASDDSVNYTALSSTVTSAGLTTTYTTTTGSANNYYKVTLTAMATYDTGGTYGTPIGTTKTLLYGTAATAPVISTQPTSQTVTTGASASFSVTAGGTGTLSYQWKKGGSAITGATSSSYTIVSPIASDAGIYSVTITNIVGSTTSNSVTLTVNPASVAPSITTQPANSTVTAGAGITFTVVASGTAPLSYQWYKGGLAVGGATTANYTIAAAQSSDAGNYAVSVVNNAGSVTSNVAALTVNPAATAPSITTPPASTSVTAGTGATFSVTASGTAPLSYQWNKNGAAISGATNSSYTIASAQSADAGGYTVTVTNSAGSITSNAATLTVSASAVAPAVTTPPANVTVTAGSGATFSVVASGTTPLSYQWSKNGSPISGATSSSYTLASAQAADAASYTVTVTNSAGVVTSNAATLTLSATAVAPAITTPPASSTVNAGSNVTFTVVASGTAPLSYQWSKNGTAIGGATGASYTVSAAQSADAGSYTVTATNSAGAVTSSAATLTVSTVSVAPTISTQPASTTIAVGGNVTLSVSAGGTAPLSYQWYKGVAAISGATASSYALTNVQTGDAGTYAVVVTNSVGSITSNAATLTVDAPANAPTITQQPANAAVSVLNPVTFSVVATGSPAPAYQWKKNGTDIFGATSATYTIAQALAFDAATYTVLVTNASGSVTSNAATLTVGTSPVGPSLASQPQAATAALGTSVTFAVIANGTAPFVYQWLKDNVLIAGATSASYTIASVQAGDAGSYTCAVGNDYGSTVSAAAALTVNTTVIAPSITTQPSNQTVDAGTGASFTIVAGSTAPLTYQWYRGVNALSGATSATYAIASAQAGDAGGYAVVVTNSAGSTTSNTATLTVNSTNQNAAVAPAITAPPAGATVIAGARVTFTVTASGTAPLSYQWLKNGALISGATGASYAIASAQTTDAASYTVTVSNSAGSVTSAAAALVVSTPPPVAPTLAAGIVNLAVRTRIGGVAGTPITGFVLRGTGPGKTLIFRAVGPTLIASFGLASGLADPSLNLLSGNTLVASNDNWLASDAAAMAAVGAFPLNLGSGDAVIVRTLVPGTYTTPVSAPAGTSGVVLIECYDAAGADPRARLVNASARAYVGTGNDVLIPAFTIAGEGTVRVLIRAVGPGLAAFGVPGTLADPQITLFSGTAAVAGNDNWGDAANAAEIATTSAQNGAFALGTGSRDAVLLGSLSAGSYSAVVSGVAGGTGAVLVEIYVVP